MLRTEDEPCGYWERKEIVKGQTESKRGQTSTTVHINTHDHVSKQREMYSIKQSPDIVVYIFWKQDIHVIVL